MIHSVQDLQKRFEQLLKNVKGTPTTQFTKMAEMAFEAVICVKAINEYAKVYGKPSKITNPTTFLNQKPGSFDTTKAFRVEFPSVTFYFATDVECYGLSAFNANGPIGDIFEADVVVIDEKHVQEIAHKFKGNPAPQHLNAAYECKFGAYHKSQLRELLGFRRHVSLRSNPDPNNHSSGYPFNISVNMSNPDIQIILFRPTQLPFLQTQTAQFYDLHQQIYP